MHISLYVVSDSLLHMLGISWEFSTPLLYSSDVQNPHKAHYPSMSTSIMSHVTAVTCSRCISTSHQHSKHAANPCACCCLGPSKGHLSKQMTPFLANDTFPSNQQCPCAIMHRCVSATLLPHCCRCIAALMLLFCHIAP
jgi:hypothetical protein